MTVLNTQEIEIGSNITASIIWLHGLGANGHDFEPIVPELNLPSSIGIRFIFPHSPSIPVTINGGVVMPAWYDILDFSAMKNINEEQLLISADKICTLIDKEIEKGIPSERIILAGFSQGGAVVYETFSNYSKKLGGLMGLSTYYPTAHLQHDTHANKTTPILIMHGNRDPIVPLQLGEEAMHEFKKQGFEPEFKVFNMEHSVCPEQISLIGKWLNDVLTTK